MGQLNYEWATRQHRGATVYQCLDCAYNNIGLFGKANILGHCKSKGHGLLTEVQGTIDDYIANVNGNNPKSVIITLGYLCWNTRDISVEGVLALIAEAERLKKLGHIPFIYIVDNGSADGTADAIRMLPLPSYVRLRCLPENMGISYARNLIIDFSVARGSKYTMFMDGDIEIVPLSSFTMIRYLECHPDIGVIGAYSAGFSAVRSECAKSLVEIAESRVKKDIKCAWTQYGLFRASLWTKGVRFDESGPFGKPGWGFEDDDLHYQIAEAGFGNRYFAGMVYLHRALHSSWGHLAKTGTDLDNMFKLRKGYLIQKWRSRGLEAGILKMLEGQRLPEATDVATE